MATLGIGGGGGFVAKKMMHKKAEHQGVIPVKKIIDKKLENEIAELEDKFNSIEKAMIELKKDVHANTAFDKQFRDQMQREHDGVKDDMKELKKQVQQILGHLLNK